VRNIIRIYQQGLSRLSKRGRRILALYAAALSLVALIDGGALYLLGRILKSDTTAQLSDWGSQKIGFLFVMSLFILRSLIATAITWIGLQAFAEQEVYVGQENLNSLDDSGWESRRSTQLGQFLTTIDRGPNALVQGFLVSVATILSESFTALVIFSVLMIMEPMVAVTSIAYFAFVAIMQHRLLSMASAKAGVVVHDEGNKVYDLINDGFHLSKLLMVMPSMTFNEKLNHARLDLAKARAKKSFLNSLPRYFMEAVLAIGFLTTAVVAYLVNGENGMIASLTIFAATGFRLLPVVNRIQGLALSLFGDAPLAESSLIQTKKDIRPPIKNVVGNQVPFLRLENVSFRYLNANKNTIHNFSFDFERGKKYALVGPSGSGKTTLADICIGLLKPSEGKVTWSSIPNIGYVPQETLLSSADLAGNISIEWDREFFDSERVIRSAKLARLIEFENQSALFQVNQKVQLSGGQKQRLGIARAIYRLPDFLVLDEATSALDSTLESEVTQSLDLITSDTTVIFVAHRLSTIQHLDQILYIESGTLTGQGTFSELRKSHKKFAQQIELGEIK
jgi:ABC-type multidrug transport system fused ATPase/permease subunit